MARHIIIVDSPADCEWARKAGKAVTLQQYVETPDGLSAKSTRVINLSAHLEYLDLGYYCSLLAEARGQKVVPTIETILNLSRKALYSVELPDLNHTLRDEIRKLPSPPQAAFTLTVYFGQPAGNRFRAFARQLFDRFRCPLMRVHVEFDERWSVKTLETIAPRALSPEEFEFFLGRLEHYTRADWRAPKARPTARYALGVLYDPAARLPPSSPETIRKFVAVGAQMGIDVETIERKDYLRLAEYDALFIRETTALQNHTFRFAQKAVFEGIPVIDDPVSILRCTNKVYLAELLQTNKVPAPRTVIVDRQNILNAELALAYPLVLKIPDGSFSRGVVKVENRSELLEHSRRLFRHSAVILAQEFMYTEYDWRVGVLNRKPIFVSQYFMSRKHWQIINHKPGGGFAEGAFRAVAVEDAPPEVLEAGVRAANLVGDGLYGVDLKRREDGVFVIEINDNPNIDRGVEDGVLKDDLYKIVLADFVRRIESR
jgi:glutathione synthase/RimK-type ligase-like ATP-grasp enzyme